MMSQSLTVVILTYNEERHIGRAIESVAGIARKVLVVDSFSTDRTVEIAQALGATVVQHPFVNYAKQYQWALDTQSIDSDWVMRMDADEIVEPDLALEISANLPRLPDDVAGVNLKRKHIFMGHWVRHGGRYPLVLLRIWRRGVAEIEDRWMDEHMRLLRGHTVTFNGGFSDFNLGDITFFINKHNKYATREAVDVLCQRYSLSGEPSLSSQHCSHQAAAKRFIKERIYNHLPLWAGPLGYFLYRYFIQLGFLDGPTGLIYHVLQGFWYRFLVAAKLYELDAEIAGMTDTVAIIDKIEHLTGHKLTT